MRRGQVRVRIDSNGLLPIITHDILVHFSSRKHRAVFVEAEEPHARYSVVVVVSDGDVVATGLHQSVVLSCMYLCMYVCICRYRGLNTKRNRKRQYLGGDVQRSHLVKSQRLVLHVIKVI